MRPERTLATTPNLIEPLADEAAKPIEPVQPPARARPSDPIMGELDKRTGGPTPDERQRSWAAQVAREESPISAAMV